MESQTDSGVPLSTLSPKFLNSNSTSHTWPFSAIAELIDNAYDPDVKAKQLWIDVIEINGEKCLSFMDNGNGLNFETMHKMLSFGYSEKKTVSGQKPIGIYGNGFKSGSMRLGKDAIVFSKSRSMSCVGMLSQTYLEKIGAHQIRVPIVCFEKRKSDKFFIRDEHKSSLQDILRYSLFKTKEELLIEINAINSFGSTETTGTRIIIWNLRRTSTGATEFDFERDRSDIQISLEFVETQDDSPQHANRNTSSIPDSVYSLKAYCEILYLKPRMQIVVRGQRVKSILMAKSLACIRKDHYKPTFLGKHIPITFGYNTQNKEQYGIMMYHKNRLIKAYERVGCQLKPNTKGVGVIGVIECEFLEPTHNKQSFTENDKYRKTIINLGVKLEEYWNEIRYIKSKNNPNSIPVEDTMKEPDQNWVQCDDCLKWRKLPDGINNKKLPKKWYCRMNPDPQFRSCLVDEELEDLDDQPSYNKTYKQQEKEEKKKQEKKLEQDQVHEAQELSAMNKEFEVLNQQHKNIMQQLFQKPRFSPTAQRTRSQQGRTLKVKFCLPSTSSQAACSPSPTPGLPVITNVSSLAGEAQRGKRTQLVTSQSTPKRPKINYFLQSTSSTPSSEDESSTYVNNNDQDNDGDKQNPVTMLLKGSKKTAVDTTSEEAAAGTSTAVKTSCPPQVVNSFTQTSVKPESNQGEQILPNGEAHMESDETPGPSTLPQFPRIIEVLQQQDQLLELMQDTAQERDSLKQEVQILTIQLQEQPHVSVKKECSHQGCQTEEDYKSLFQKTKQKINDLIKDKKAFIVAAEAKTSLNTDRDEERDVDEISLQVGCLVNKLDQTEKQRDELRSQLHSLEEERSKLADRCEELRQSLQQQRENAQASKRVGEFSAQSGSEAGASTNSDTNTDIFKSLLELRQNVGRLLISYVPALDLEQVNYQCNVIDEILEQVLNGGQM